MHKMQKVLYNRLILTGHVVPFLERLKEAGGGEQTGEQTQALPGGTFQNTIYIFWRDKPSACLFFS